LKKSLGIAFIIIGLLWSYTSQCQLTTDADFKRQVFDRAYTFGVIFHTRGYSINGRYLKYIDGYNARGLEIDFAKLRHPKEVISSNEGTVSARGFVFGRINSFYTLRTGYIHQSILYDKTDKGSVSISWLASGGLSLGLLKPIYLQVNKFTSDDPDPRLYVERYDGTNQFSRINGEANFFVGIDEIKLRPGVYVKGGFEFDYQLLDKKITSVETGIIYDYYFAEVPIFFENNEDINWSGFFQMYLAVNFGYKKN
jgi:hypothetical protein